MKVIGLAGLLALGLAIGIISSSSTDVIGQILVPSWVKNDAKWWYANQISDDEFEKGIAYLMDQKIINIPPQVPMEYQTKTIPVWVKNLAGVWVDGKVSDSDFLIGIEYLTTVGLIQVHTTTPNIPSPTVPTIPNPTIPAIPNATIYPQNTTASIANASNQQSNQSITQNQPSTVPLLPMLMLYAQSDHITMRYPYQLAVKIFEPGANPQKVFDQFNGGISDVVINGTIIYQNNLPFATFYGKTDGKGLFQYQIQTPYQQATQQIFKVMFTASKKGYIPQNATISFVTTYST